MVILERMDSWSLVSILETWWLEVLHSSCELCILIYLYGEIAAVHIDDSMPVYMMTGDCRYCADERNGKFR